ncbi:MAG: hypothetical protein QNK37_11110 [Acidobacteriota bacterium]|nr:hypothetical protein [Acidobacteriota bacterium]
MTERLKSHGYRIPQKAPALANQGSVFKHNDGLPSVGLYLMPDHKDNGMLEDLLWENLLDDEVTEDLRRYAEKVIKGLPHRRFTENHQTKALLYSWLAWQKRPGQTMDVTIHGKLLDYDRETPVGFFKWFSRVFPFAEGKQARLR